MTGQTFHRFGPFVIIRELGRGGMGEVFLARTPWAEHPLAAVKRLRPDVARVPTFAERFRHEAALAVRLAHPNIVATLDVGAVEDQVYVVSELVMGKDTGYIADRLRMRSQGGPAAVAVRLVLDGLAGLAYVHGACEADGSPLGLVHRDVTPGNLLVGYDGRARLADFGLAKSHLSEGSRLTKQGEILGTPHYLAPEVVKGNVAEPASDIYGLGAVIYRFLTGIAPFQGSTSEVLMKVLTERPRPLAVLRPDLPPWLVELVEGLLVSDVRQRPSDAGALAERIHAKAKTENILVQKGAVGRWLAQLFQDEHDEEVEERARLVQLDPSQLEPPRESTVVLARAVGEDRLSGPEPILTSLGEEEGQGTELELAASAVLGVSPPIEDYGAEMPTRAVEVLSRSDRPEPEEEPDFDTEIEQLAARKARLGLVDIDETVDAAALPGFADTLREREPSAESPPPPAPRAIPESSDPLLVTPVEDGTPQRPMPRDLTPRSEVADRTGGLRRSVLFLAGLLSLAVALGIGLGKIVARLRASAEPIAAPLAAPPPQEVISLKARLNELNRRLEASQEEGLEVPPAAWRHVAQAASALLEGDESTAKKHLGAAEALLESSR